MAEIKTREKSKGIKALDKAVVAGERRWPSRQINRKNSAGNNKCLPF